MNNYTTFRLIADGSLSSPNRTDLESGYKVEVAENNHNKFSSRIEKERFDFCVTPAARATFTDLALYKFHAKSLIRYQVIDHFKKLTDQNFATTI